MSVAKEEESTIGDLRKMRINFNSVESSFLVWSVYF